MKVGIISTSDSRGGAFAAAYRLHQGLVQVGTDATMLVRDKTNKDSTVVSDNTKLAKVWAKLAPHLDILPLHLYRERDLSMYSLQWVPDGVPSQVAQLDLDIINLHWVCHSYVKIETFSQFNKPLVWTLQDMWAFTGGCHYNQDCDRYTDSCGACPQLNSNKDRDLSRWVWQRKAKAWKNLDLTIVTPSSWLANCASSSSLFQNRRVEVIPFALDTKKYQPVDKRVARQILDLPQDKQLVLFGATGGTVDKRKGFHLLLPALQNLVQSGWKDKIELVVFGASEPQQQVDLGFKAHYVGRFNDDLSLALVYSAADVMVAPSIQEAFGQTASEALACATPVVTFKGTGLADIPDHQQNGYVANNLDVDDLARGIAWILENRDRHQKLCVRAREKAEKEFALEVQARRYLSLFGEILSK